MLDTACNIGTIGESARGWLVPGQRGEVVASVSRAAYLLTEEIKLFWLTGKSSPMHRRCLQLTSPIPELAVGSHFDVQDQALVMSSGATLDFSRSTIWKAPVLLDRKPVPVAWVAALVRYTYLRMIAEKEPSGWGCMIPAILQNVASRSTEETGAEKILSEKAWSAIHGIIQACRSHDFERVLAHAQDLVGLGDGLTPSGDDFLGGFFYCIWLLKQAYPADLDIGSWNYSDFILQCKHLTNLISFTLMSDHAHGHAMEPMHHIANALVRGEPVDHFLPYAMELASIGHSTGWDILTGFLAGMSVAFVP